MASEVTIQKSKRFPCLEFCWGAVKSTSLPVARNQTGIFLDTLIY
jgi:hypothetical protein